jgi:hypothetical protein
MVNAQMAQREKIVLPTDTCFGVWRMVADVLISSEVRRRQSPVRSSSRLRGVNWKEVEFIDALDWAAVVAAVIPMTGQKWLSRHFSQGMFGRRDGVSAAVNETGAKDTKKAAVVARVTRSVRTSVPRGGRRCR